MQSTIDRFLSKVTVNQNTGCWEWLDNRTSRKETGYGRFTIRREGKKCRYAAHRWSYETFIGPIAEGLQLDHLCRVRHCVNPQHLEPVTAAENSRRGSLARNRERNALLPKPSATDNFPDILGPEKIYCKYGHKLIVENTYVYPKKNLVQCRTCVLEAANLRHSRKRYEAKLQH